MTYIFAALAFWAAFSFLLIAYGLIRRVTSLGPWRWRKKKVY